MRYTIYTLLLLFVFGCGADEGTQGRSGPQGTTGETRVWYNGFGAPEAAIGEEGDFYVDDDNGDYYKKTDNSWIRQGNLEGPPGKTGAGGDKGEKGDRGEKGDQGIKGDTGVAGTNGTNGVDGTDGATGAKGNKGSKGDKGDKGDAGATGVAGTSNDLKFEIICEDTLPGLATYKFWYYVAEFDNGDVFASARLYDDEDEYGSGSRFYHSSHDNYDKAYIKMNFDKQQNDNWGYYEIGAGRTSLDYTVNYTDSTDGDENYTVSSECTKTTF